jgi:hypothetical protein
VEFRKEEKRNAYKMLMERNLETNCMENREGKRRITLKCILGKPTVRKELAQDPVQLANLVLLALKFRSLPFYFYRPPYKLGSRLGCAVV